MTSTPAPGTTPQRVGDAVDVEVVAADPLRVQRAARVDRRGEQDEVARRAGGLDRGVHRHSAPPMHQPTRLSSSWPLARRTSRIAHGQRVADVVVQADVASPPRRGRPSRQEDVVALVEQVLHERVPRAQVEDVGPVDQREDEQDRARPACAGSTGSGRASSCGASRRRPSGDAPIVASSRREQDVRELDRGDRRAGELGEVGAMASVSALRRAAPRGRGARPPLAVALPAAARLELLAEPLDLLQDQLQLVLGPGDLAREPGDVRPPGEPQVAHHEVDRAVARSASRAMTFSVMRTSSEPKLSRDDEILHGPGHLGLRLVVEPLHLVGRTGSVLSPRSPRYPGSRPLYPRDVAEDRDQRARGDHPPPAGALGDVDAPVLRAGGDLQSVPLADRARAARAVRAGASSRSRRRCARRPTRSTSRPASRGGRARGRGRARRDQGRPAAHGRQRRALLAVYQAFLAVNGAPRHRRRRTVAPDVVELVDGDADVDVDAG